MLTLLSLDGDLESADTLVMRNIESGRKCYEAWPLSMNNISSVHHQRNISCFTCPVQRPCCLMAMMMVTTDRAVKSNSLNILLNGSKQSQQHSGHPGTLKYIKSDPKHRLSDIYVQIYSSLHGSGGCLLPLPPFLRPALSCYLRTYISDRVRFSTVLRVDEIDDTHTGLDAATLSCSTGWKEAERSYQRLSAELVFCHG